MKHVQVEVEAVDHLRFGHNETKRLPMVFYIVFGKQDLAKHLGIAALGNVIWP